jgi:hypothetical protein
MPHTRSQSVARDAEKHRERLDRIYRINRMFAQNRHRVQVVSKQANLFRHSLTPMPAAAAHRLPPSEALERKHKPRKTFPLARSPRLARGTEKRREKQRTEEVFLEFAVKKMGVSASSAAPWPAVAC